MHDECWVLDRSRLPQDAAVAQDRHNPFLIHPDLQAVSPLQNPPLRGGNQISLGPDNEIPNKDKSWSLAIVPLPNRLRKEPL